MVLWWLQPLNLCRWPSLSLTQIASTSSIFLTFSAPPHGRAPCEMGDGMTDVCVHVDAPVMMSSLVVVEEGSPETKTRNASVCGRELLKQVVEELLLLWPDFYFGVAQQTPFHHFRADVEVGHLSAPGHSSIDPASPLDDAPSLESLRQPRPCASSSGRHLCVASPLSRRSHTSA